LALEFTLILIEVSIIHQQSANYINRLCLQFFAYGFLDTNLSHE